MRLAVLLLLAMSTHYSLTAQSMLFNKDGGSPDASAMLEVRSTEKGFLPPRMTASQRTSISSPAQGLTVFQTNGTVGYYFYNGSGWDTLGGANTTITTNISNITNVSNSGIAVIRDVKSSGSDGGTFNSGNWRIRDLNHLDGDSSFVSLDSDTITLDSGIYEITVIAPAANVKTNQCRLYNSTESEVQAYGNVAFADKFSLSTLTVIVNVTNATESFIVQHRCSDSVSGSGFGEGTSWGETVYTQVKISKL